MRESKDENQFEEIMTENFPNLVKEADIKSQEAWTKIRNPKRLTPKHIKIKKLKFKYKKRILKAAREKQLLSHKGVPIRLEADFSKETM